MTKQTKFIGLLDQLKTNANATLIESIKSGYKLLIESDTDSNTDVFEINDWDTSDDTHIILNPMGGDGQADAIKNTVLPLYLKQMPPEEQSEWKESWGDRWWEFVIDDVAEILEIQLYVNLDTSESDGEWVYDDEYMSPPGDTRHGHWASSTETDVGTVDAQFISEKWSSDIAKQRNELFQNDEIKQAAQGYLKYWSDLANSPEGIQTIQNYMDANHAD
jgi:hypothetical protein